MFPLLRLFAACLPLIFSFSASLHAEDALRAKVKAYQEALVRSKVTGSNIAGVFQGSEVLALNSVSSTIDGDKAVNENTIFPIWSMSKPITIVAMMILLDKESYRLSDPVEKYIPYFSNIMCKSEIEEDEGEAFPCKRKLLVEHLLTHRSGFQYYQNDVGGPDHTDAYENLDEFVRHAASHPLEFEPGSKYLYGINQAILGRLIEVMSGSEFYKFLDKEIFGPLDMVDTKFFLTQEDRKRFQPLYRKAQKTLNDPGIRADQGKTQMTTNFDELTYALETKAQFGGEGLVGTFSDYRKFCEMLLAGGEYQGKRIISPKTFSLMTKAVSGTEISRGYDDGMAYAFSFFTLQEPMLDGTGSPKGIFGWSGYHNTHFWIDQTNGIFGLFMTRTTPFTFEIQKQFRSAVYSELKKGR